MGHRSHWDEHVSVAELGRRTRASRRALGAASVGLRLVQLDEGTVEFSQPLPANGVRHGVFRLRNRRDR